MNADVDFSKIGQPVGKDAPEEVLQYLNARGWRLADTRAANLRIIDGEQVAEIWPGSKRGYRNPAYTDGFVIDPKTKNAYWPRYGLVLPDTRDSTYGTVRVFTEIGIVRDAKDVQRFRTPTGRPPIAYFPRRNARRDLLDKRKPIYFIESPFKGFIAVQRGVLAIGVSGCHGAHEPETHLPKNATRGEARTSIACDLHPYLLQGRKVTLLTDADAQTNLNVGRSLVQFMEAAATGFGCIPEFIAIPDLGDGVSGIDDYFAAGHSLKDFNALPRHGLDAPCVTAMRCAQFDLTEAGLADRFVARHAQDHRHDHQIGEWFSYTPQGYRTGRVEPRRAMRETVESLKAETAAARGTDSIRERKRFQALSGKNAAMNAALALAADDDEIEIDAGLFDSDSDLLGMQNGVLRLSSGMLLQPSRELLVTKATPFSHDPRVRSKLWEQVIARASGGDAQLLRHMQEILGTLILGRADRSEVILVYGLSATAKSVVLEAFMDGLGSDYAIASKSGILMKARQPSNAEAATPFLFSMRGKRFVACSELEQGETVSDSTLKDLTGGDTISARALHKGSITFRNTARVVIRCNHLPNIVGTDDSVWSRIQLVPFNVVIPEGERDKDLRAKLAREFPGIFNWAYVGLRRYVERGYRFDVPKSVIALMTDYRKKSDVLGTWLEECVESDPKVDGDSCKEIQAEVTSSYIAWASRNGHGVMSAKLLWDRIRGRLGFDPVYAGDRGVKYAKGFKLRRGSDNVLALMQEDSDTKDLQIDRLRAQVAALKAAQSGLDGTTSTTPFGAKVSRPH